MKIFRSFILIFGIPGILFCQKNAKYDSLAILKKASIGTSLTYIFDQLPPRYHEYTWSTNASFSITNRLFVGVNGLWLWTNSDVSGKNNYHIIGAFAQYRALQTKKVWWFPEMGFFNGNYCTCGSDEPYKKRNVNYFAIGGGVGIKLFKQFSLDLAFINYKTIVKAPFNYNYTQYVIGLDYNFYLKKKLFER